MMHVGRVRGILVGTRIRQIERGEQVPVDRQDLVEARSGCAGRQDPEHDAVG